MGEKDDVEQKVEEELGESVKALASPPKEKEETVKIEEAGLKRIKRLERELKEEQEKAESYLNRLKYLQADFENYQKRMQKQLKEASERANERMASSLLSVIDELELAIKAAERSEDNTAVTGGVKMVLKNLLSILDKEGLKPIEAVGKPFDPRLHEAVEKVPGKEGDEGLVVEEVRRGFIFKDRVIRPSLVKVLVGTPPSKEGRVAEVKVD